MPVGGEVWTRWQVAECCEDHAIHRNEADKAAGLEAGADDYIGKPFGERELVARIRASLRRCYELTQPTLFQFGDVELNPNTVTLTVKGKPVDTTLSEFRLLEYFVRNPGRTFSRDHLLKMIRSNLGDVKPRMVDVYVKKIRRKIEVHEENPKYLRTVRGLGYCFHLPDMPVSLYKRRIIFIMAFPPCLYNQPRSA